MYAGGTHSSVDEAFAPNVVVGQKCIQGGISIEVDEVLEVPCLLRGVVVVFII
jgi:hypothetical protein